MSTDTLPPLDDLDRAFCCPKIVTDLSLRALYEVLVIKMRKEASHLSMTTVQLLLIERIAANYVIMRHLEDATEVDGDIVGFKDAKEQKDFNTFWLSMTTEFNRHLRATDTDSKEQIVRALATVVLRVLDEQVTDEVQKDSLRNTLANELEEAGF